MQNNVNYKIAIPAKRYFTLAEVCELLEISSSQFQEWQQKNGIIIGYGANRFTRQDVIKLRKLKSNIDSSVHAFNSNALDQQDNPAIDADGVRHHIQEMLEQIEKALVN